MQRIVRFLRLPSCERRLLAQSMFLVGMIRLGLWMVPFHTLRSFLARLAKPNPVRGKEQQASLEKIVRAVEQSSRLVPLATCLTQALATQVLLGQQGYPATLRIGVLRGDEGKLQAHAWVESNGLIVIGASQQHDRYTLLPPLGGDGS